MVEKFSLRPEQARMADSLYPSSALLLGRVGSGKTATALSALKRRHLIVGRKRTLVLGTVRICNTVWGPQIKLLAPHLSYASAAELKPAQREALLESDLDVVGLNYENLAWAVKKYGEKLPAMFPNLIIDESSLLENPSGKVARKLHGILHLFEWRLPMTGTPRANHLHDLWGNAYLADCGEALGKYKEAFYQKWFTPIQRAFGVEWIPKFGAADEIYERLNRVAYALPFTCRPVKVINVTLLINPVVRGCYAAIAGFLSDDDNEGGDFTYCDATVIRGGHQVTGKLLQFSSGRVYSDEGKVVHIHDDKLDALEEIVAEAKGEPVMVVYQYTHEVDAIKGRFPEAVVINTDEALAAWNRGEVGVALAHPKSCGHGVEAQFGGYIQVWFTPTMDGELYAQTIGRLNRPGVKEQVQVIRLIMEHTDDLRAYGIAETKGTEDNEAIERVR